MHNRFFVLVFFLSNLAFGQGKPVLVFDLVNQTTDSITNITYDENIQSENTPHNIGCFNPSIEFLDPDLPSSNLFPGSNFTRKKRASIDFNLSSFPLRTSVKIFRVNGDSLGDLCSGSLISKKHVITAAHCISGLNTNELVSDSLYIAPVFDNGEFNSNFQGTDVIKVYFFKNWSLQGEDIAILELAEPIGELTGWISIGFVTDDWVLEQSIFYKFSYPTAANLNLDPNEYNGDTLYYNYGRVDKLTENRIGISNAIGVGGDSGSSIIRVENGEKYIAYGLLSLANNLIHSRINNWRYYAIKSIIKNDIGVELNFSDNDFVVYPNPAEHSISIQKPDSIEVLEFAIFDNAGRKCLLIEEPKTCLTLDVSSLSSGMYHMNIVTAKGIVSKKIVKL